MSYYVVHVLSSTIKSISSRHQIISLDVTIHLLISLSLFVHCGHENQTTIARIAVGKLIGARWKRAIDVENSDTAYMEQRQINDPVAITTGPLLTTVLESPFLEGDRD